MGAAASALASCFGGCFASCACSCVQSACQTIGRRGSLIPYFMLLFLSTILAFVLRYFGGPIVINLTVTQLSLCTDAQSNCYGFGALVRISATLTFFFLSHILITSIAKLKWIVKSGLLILFSVGCWFLPDQFYDVFVDISRFSSAIFLLLQLIILVDFAYHWQENWTSEERPWQKPVLFAASGLFVVSFVLLVLCGVWFAGPGCQLQQFFVSFTGITTTIFSILAISPVIDGGGLLPAAVVTAYSVYLLFTSLSSDPSQCNSLYPDGGAEKSDSSNAAQSIINILVSAITICYAAYNVTSSNTLFASENDSEVNAGASADASTALLAGSAPSEQAMEAGEARADAPAPSSENEDAPPEAEFSARSYRRFFLVFSFAAMYLCMLLTNWGDRDSSENSYMRDDTMAKENMWVKIVSSWAVGALFVWSLVAPKILANRDFS